MKFTIDKTASRFTVHAFATGLLSSFGHDPTIGILDFDGSIDFVPNTYDKAFVQITLRTNQMDVLDEMKNDDRKKLEQSMYDEVLEVQRFPTASFVSQTAVVEKLAAGLLNARVTGNLTFHGVTQSLTVNARVTDLGSMLRISGEFPLQQTEYGITPYSFAAGALRLKDELKFKFELVARMQE